MVYPRPPYAKELQGAVLDLRSEAAALCELMSAEERSELMTSLLTLPTQKLEAAVTLVASRMALTVQAGKDPKVGRTILLAESLCVVLRVSI